MEGTFLGPPPSQPGPPEAPQVYCRNDASHDRGDYQRHEEGTRRT